MAMDEPGEEQRSQLADGEPAHAVDDDLLGPESRRTDEEADVEPEDELPVDEAQRPPRRRSSALVVAWTLVAVLAIFAALTFAELLRVSKSLNEANCISRADANYTASAHSGLNAQQAGLERLSLRLALDKCGQ